MNGLILRLLALLAVALMPAAMTSAPAAAQTPHASGSSTHCAGESSKPEQQEQAPSTADAHCMACAGLPASGLVGAADLALPAVPLRLAASKDITGVQPEIVTPPPKRA